MKAKLKTLVKKKKIEVNALSGMKDISKRNF